MNSGRGCGKNRERRSRRNESEISRDDQRRKRNLDGDLSVEGGAKVEEEVE